MKAECLVISLNSGHPINVTTINSPVKICIEVIIKGASVIKDISAEIIKQKNVDHSDAYISFFDRDTK